MGEVGEPLHGFFVKVKAISAAVQAVVVLPSAFCSGSLAAQAAVGCAACTQLQSELQAGHVTQRPLCRWGVCGRSPAADLQALPGNPGCEGHTGEPAALFHFGRWLGFRSLRVLHRRLMGNDTASACPWWLLSLRCSSAVASSGPKSGPPLQPFAVLSLLWGTSQCYPPQLCSPRALQIIATPFSTSFDHMAIADEIHYKFQMGMAALQGEGISDLPLFGLGHSMGALQHLIVSSRYVSSRQGNMLMSFNNKPATESIPFFSPFIAPGARAFGPILAQVRRLEACCIGSHMTLGQHVSQSLHMNIVQACVPAMQRGVEGETALTKLACSPGEVMPYASRHLCEAAPCEVCTSAAPLSAFLCSWQPTPSPPSCSMGRRCCAE